MISSRARLCGAAVTAFMFCTTSCTAGEKPQPVLTVKELVITTKDGKTVPVRAELARSQAEHNKGLMFRTALADGEGMLFVFQEDTVLSFWMKNTLLPLSIAYISKEGVIREIYDMKPHQLNAVRSLRSMRYALEVPQGWFSRAGVSIGDSIQL